MRLRGLGKGGGCSTPKESKSAKEINEHRNPTLTDACVQQLVRRKRKSLPLAPHELFQSYTSNVEDLVEPEG